MIKGIIFDAYGTLLSTADGSVRAAQQVLVSVGAQIDATLFYREWKIIHKSHIRSIENFMSEKDIFIRDLEVLYRRYLIKGDPKTDVRYMIESQYGRLLYPDVLPVLPMLARTYDLFIGSTSDTAPLLDNLTQGGVHQLFDGIYTSQSLRVYKPCRHFYTQILEYTNLSAKEVVFVGDSLDDDVWGPQQLGIYAIWLNRSAVRRTGGVMPDNEICTLPYLESCIPHRSC